MEFNDWLLVLHLLSAFALAGAIILFWAVIVALRSNDLPGQASGVGRMMKVGGAVVGVGSLGTLIFGIWLAIALDGVQVWDGWVIAAIVLWAITAETGRRSGEAYKPYFTRAEELVTSGQTGPDPGLRQLAQSSHALMLHTAATVGVLLILADMIWKPGA